MKRFHHLQFRRLQLRRLHSERGVTLVELVISIVILSIIMGTISTALVTAVSGSRPTQQRARESDDAQVIAAYLVRDAQSAGGTNPTTGITDTSSGVSAPATATECFNTPVDGAVIVRFNWKDWATRTVSHRHVVNYFFDSSKHQIVRKSCVDGAGQSNTKLAGFVGSVGHVRCVTSGTEADCPATTTLPDLVKLTVTETNDPPNAPSPYSYTLTASTRPEGGRPTGPDPSTSTKVALLSLGGTCGDGVTGIQAQGGGASQVRVYGAADVNGGCPAVQFQGSIDMTATDGISVLAPGTCSGVSPACGSYTTAIGDPYETLAPPAADCVNGTHSGPVGTTYSPGTYQTAVSVSNATFLPGIYIFCNGLTTSGNVSANNVLFYFAGGSFSVSGTFVATAPASGTYGSELGGANIVVWQSMVDTAHARQSVYVCCSNNTTATFGGTVYAPRSFVDLHNGTLSMQSIVALGVSWTGGGNGGTTIGVPPAVPLSLDTTSLPAWTINRPYPNTTMAVSGGTGGYLWSATGLPANLSINALTGVISGTPTTANTYTVNVTVGDSIGESVTKTYSLRINGVPLINGPASLKDWTINRDYPGTAITAAGGTTPYAWTATGLPTGLTIDSATGVVSGTPSATGTFTPTVKLTDASGATDTKNYTVTINTTPSITGPATLPNWTTGQVYPNQTMTATNGTLPYSWAASGLPTGLSINAGTGVISGTPNAAGTFAVAVTMTDTAGASATRNYSVTINPAPGIATASLPTAEVGRPYNFTLTPSVGGTPPYTWSLPTRPAWLTVNASTGVLSGTPTTAGAPPVTVRITDSTGASSSKNYSLTVAAAVQISGPASMPDWTINRDYPGTAIIGTGGVTPYLWSATGLPNGLSINSGTGVISGTPSATGTFSIVVTVADALGGSDTQSYTVTINPSPTIATGALANGEKTVAYNMTVVATGGTPNAGKYTWAASGLPTGLSISSTTGTITGTPTQNGSFDITVTATDVAGASGSKIFLGVIFGSAPTITGPASLPSGAVSVGYPATLITFSGGTAPLTWSATGLPGGLTIDSSSGIISGTPTAAGTFSVTVKVTDSFNVVATRAYTVVISSAPTITTSTLPSSTVNTPYPNITMAASGGTGSRTWSATGLPTGVTINATSGLISGTPTVTGPFTPTITVIDSIGASNSRGYSFTINDVPTIATASLPDGTQGVAYSILLAASNGTPVYTWSATGLPANLTITGGGLISGNPTVTGTFPVNITLTDASGATANATLSITIRTAIAIAPATGIAAWTVNRAYPPTAITATGGTGTYSWSATGLPAGMSINGATGVISGTPTATLNSGNVVVTASDTAVPPQSKSRTYTLTINAAPAISTTSCTVRKSRAIGGFTLGVTGGTGPYTWSASGAPSWIIVNPAGSLDPNGTAPNTPGATFPFSLTVIDAAGASTTATFTITILNSGSGSC